jgi:hypothetical protein
VSDGPDYHLVVPRMTRTMKILSIFVASSWLFVWIAANIPIAGALQRVIELVWLQGDAVLHGQIWRVVTYVMLEAEFLSALFAIVFGFWFFGSQLESVVGRRRIVELAIAGTLGGALLVVVGSFVSHAWRLHPVLGTASVSGALFVGWGFQFAKQRFVPFPGLPQYSGKHIVWFFVGVQVVLFALNPQSPASLANFGGMGGAALFMLARQRFGRAARGGTRKRRRSGENLRAIPGGRDKRQMWN